MKITERLNVLRELMKEKKIDAYLVPTDDFHGSEYVGDYFKCRKYITGFTGSAGTAVIMQDMAGLWTDGRYRTFQVFSVPDKNCAVFLLSPTGSADSAASVPFFAESHGSGLLLAFLFCLSRYVPLFFRQSHLICSSLNSLFFIKSRYLIFLFNTLTFLL